MYTVTYDAKYKQIKDKQCLKAKSNGFCPLFAIPCAEHSQIKREIEREVTREHLEMVFREEERKELEILRVKRRGILNF